MISSICSIQRVALVTLWFIGASVCAMAVPSVGPPVATPSSLNSGVPTVLTVSCAVTRQAGDPPVVQASLVRVNAANQQIAVIGVMQDNGQNGDAAAGD